MTTYTSRPTRRLIDIFRGPELVPGCNGCEAGWCNAGRRHGRCDDCSAVTSDRTMRIQAETLRRRLTFCCMNCANDRHNPAHATQAALRKQRTERDWTQVSAAVETTSIRPAEMPEQYASKAREAVRAFVACGFDVATVAHSDVSSLNHSITVLGLSAVVYAESRDGETVLRRITS